MRAARGENPPAGVRAPLELVRQTVTAKTGVTLDGTLIRRPEREQMKLNVEAFLVL